MTRGGVAALTGTVVWALLGVAPSAATYDEMRSAAVMRCQAIDPAAYQTGLLFNPDGYRSYYERSACFQKAAEDFRDETLCPEVKQRWSLFSSSWGYSRKHCRELVTQGVARDRLTIEEIKRQYTQGAMRLRDFRIERNGNGRDFDIMPSFAGSYAHGYTLTFEILPPGGAAPVLVHANGYYVDAGSNLRLFARQSEVRQRFPSLTLDRPYQVRATVFLDIGNGGASGYWSDAFIESIFPRRERTQSFTKEIRF